MAIDRRRYTEAFKREDASITGRKKQSVTNLKKRMNMYSLSSAFSATLAS